MSSEHAISSVMVLNVIVAVLKDEETPLKRNLFSLKGKYANTFAWSHIFLLCCSVLSEVSLHRKEHV